MRARLHLHRDGAGRAKRVFDDEMRLRDRRFDRRGIAELVFHRDVSLEPARTIAARRASSPRSHRRPPAERRSRRRPPQRRPAPARRCRRSPSRPARRRNARAVPRTAGAAARTARPSCRRLWSCSRACPPGWRCADTPMAPDAAKSGAARTAMTPVHLLRRSSIDSGNPGMRMRRANENGVGLIGIGNVVGVAAISGDEPKILEPRHPLADIWRSALLFWYWHSGAFLLRLSPTPLFDQNKYAATAECRNAQHSTAW